jgi:hypothetical protein
MIWKICLLVGKHNKNPHISPWTIAVPRLASLAVFTSLQQRNTNAQNFIFLWLCMHAWKHASLEECNPFSGLTTTNQSHTWILCYLTQHCQRHQLSCPWWIYCPSSVFLIKWAPLFHRYQFASRTVKLCTFENKEIKSDSKEIDTSIYKLYRIQQILALCLLMCCEEKQNNGYEVKNISFIDVKSECYISYANQCLHFESQQKKKKTIHVFQISCTYSYVSSIYIYRLRMRRAWNEQCVRWQ